MELCDERQDPFRFFFVFSARDSFLPSRFTSERTFSTKLIGQPLLVRRFLKLFISSSNTALQKFAQGRLRASPLKKPLFVVVGWRVEFSSSSLTPSPLYTCYKRAGYASHRKNRNKKDNIKRIKPQGAGYRSIYSAAKQALGFTGRQREQRITIKLPLSEGTGWQTRGVFGSLK